MEHSGTTVPADIKRPFEKLGIPEAEQKFLARGGGQYESEMVVPLRLKKGVGGTRGLIFRASIRRTG